jgi:hypothetical protein
VRQGLITRLARRHLKAFDPAGGSLGFARLLVQWAVWFSAARSWGRFKVQGVKVSSDTQPKKKALAVVAARAVRVPDPAKL